MFDNHHLHVDDETVDDIVKHIQRSHGAPVDGRSITFHLFTKEFGKSIAGEAFVGVTDQNSRPNKIHKASKPTPKCTAKQARTMLVDKLVTNFKHSRSAFIRFNVSRNSAMTRAELRNALTHYHIHLDDIEFEKFVREFDKDNDGAIDFREFLSVVGAEVSGTSDNGLSVTMQAADDRQREKLKHLHKQLEKHISFDHSESEAETEAEGHLEAKEGTGHQPYGSARSDIQDDPVAKKQRVESSKQKQPGIAAARRRQQALTRSRRGGAPQVTVWDINPPHTTQPGAMCKLHRRNWRNSPSSPLPRIAAFDPLAITHQVT